MGIHVTEEIEKRAYHIVYLTDERSSRESPMRTPQQLWDAPLKMSKASLRGNAAPGRITNENKNQAHFFIFLIHLFKLAKHQIRFEVKIGCSKVPLVSFRKYIVYIRSIDVDQVT